MDKLFKVTVNGNSYDIRVEEVSTFDNKNVQNIQEPQIKHEVKTVQTQEKPKIDNTSDVIQIKAPMPGGIWKILKRAGETVKMHETILILEVMKMENEIVAPCQGTIKNILVNESDKVSAGQVIIEMI